MSLKQQGQVVTRECVARYSQAIISSSYRDRVCGHCPQGSSIRCRNLISLEDFDLADRRLLLGNEHLNTSLFDSAQTHIDTRIRVVWNSGTSVRTRLRQKPRELRLWFRPSNSTARQDKPSHGARGPPRGRDAPRPLPACRRSADTGPTRDSETLLIH